MTTQTIVNESAPYDLKGALCSSAYGASHQARISRVTARNLCGMYPLPEMGSETGIAMSPGVRLYVQNISGAYYIASPSVPVDAWPEVFRVTVKRCEVNA